MVIMRAGAPALMEWEPVDGAGGFIAKSSALLPIAFTGIR